MIVIIICDETTNPEEHETYDTGVIYCLTNNITGLKYIGQTNSYKSDHGKIKRHGIEKRFKQHIYDSRKRIKGCPKLYNAMAKYGYENFSKEVLMVCSKSLLNQMEDNYILIYNTIKNGYNIHFGNRCINVNTKQRIERQRISMKKRWLDETYRKRTLDAREKQLDHNGNELPCGIYTSERYGNTGYTIHIKNNNKIINRYFYMSNDTPDKRLRKAKECLVELQEKSKNNENIYASKTVDHNGEILPKGIMKFYDDGYDVVVRKNGKRTRRKITNKNLSMDKKLELAKNALNELRG